MGTGASGYKVTVEERRKHKLAEALIAEDKRKSEDIFKLLLLGTGDCGKSTIVKQMRILHKNGFDKEELIRNRSVIAGNILRSLCAIINAMTAFGMSFENAEREADAIHIQEFEEKLNQDGEQRPTFEIWSAMKRLWADTGLQKCFQRSNEYQLSDSTKYFCDDMDRISAQDYAPTDQDMLRVRVSTTGIVEIEFKLRNMSIIIIDVGGQRSQRKKWIHCFENVNALIFIAAISEYNQVLFEDNKVNRIHEAEMLFKTVINSYWFTKTPVVLFMNKIDLFEEKIKKYPLTMAYPEYDGKEDYDTCLIYIQLRFENQRENQRKVIYTHRTCATDTKNVEFVMDASLDIVLSKNVTKSGMY